MIIWKHYLSFMYIIYIIYQLLSLEFRWNNASFNFMHIIDYYWGNFFGGWKNWDRGLCESKNCVFWGIACMNRWDDESAKLNVVLSLWVFSQWRHLLGKEGVLSVFTFFAQIQSNWVKGERVCVNACGRNVCVWLGVFKLPTFLLIVSI